MATSPAPDAAAPPGMCPGIAVLGGGGAGGDGDGDGSGGKDGAGGDGSGSGDGAGGDGKSAQGAPDHAKYPECGYASHPVDVVTGRAFTHPITDLELPGPLPLRFQRMYSSKMAERDVGLGYGWGHTFGWEIEVSRRQIRVWNEQGIAVDFPMIAAGDEVIGPWGWLLRRDGAGFALDADDGLWRLFSATDERGKRYRLIAVEDRNRNRIALTYEKDRLTGVIDSTGRAIRVAPTREGRMVALEVKNAVARGQWVALATYTYDERGNLAVARDADGFSARYEYDEEHRLTADMDRTGLTFHFVYDREGRCVESWGDYPGRKDPSLAENLPKRLADGVTRVKGIHHCRFDYMPGAYTEVADSTQVRRFFGTRHGTLGKAVAGGSVMTAVYRDDGHLMSRTDAVDATTHFERDARGRLTKLTDAAGRVTEIARDAAGLPVRVVDPAGGVTRYERDRFGNVLLAVDPLNGSTSLRYDARGLLTEVVMPSGARTVYAWDAQGNLASVTLANGATWRFVHDALGRQIAATDPTGASTRLVWSAAGKLVAVYDALGGVTRYVFDGERHLTAASDPKGHTRHFLWGGYHRMCGRIDADGNEVRLRYDLEGQLIEVRNENGEVHRLEYDTAGRFVGEVTFDGRTLRYRNDPLGRPVQIKTASGEITTLVYDSLGRLVEREWPDGEVEAFTYDPLGRLVTAKCGAVEVKVDRDASGRIVREIQGVAAEEHAVELAYDADGARVRRASLGHSEAIERDVLGLRVRTTLDEGHVVEHTSDLLGREVARALPLGGRIESVYDPLGRLARQRVMGPTVHRPRDPAEPDWVGPVQGTSVAERAYRYDWDGELMETWDSLRGRTEYRYDPLGHVLAAVPEKARSEVFRYDPAGNIHEGGDGAPARAYGPGNRLLRRGDTRYLWDDAGRLVEKRAPRSDGGEDCWRYAWNGAGLLASIEAPGGTVVELTYDPLARRVQKRVLAPRAPGERPAQVSLTRFVWDGSVLAHEITARAAEAGDPVVETRSYCFEDDSFRPLAHKDRGEWFHYVNDPAGVPERLVSADGSVAAELVRRAFRIEEGGEGARTRTPLRLPGQYEDEETGLCYNRHRYYDPEIGAFITPDPLSLAAGLNAYAYPPNTLLWLDPLGLAFQRIYTVPEVQQMLDDSEGRLSVKTGQPGHPRSAHTQVPTPELRECSKSGGTKTSLGSDTTQARAVTDALNSPAGQAALGRLDQGSKREPITAPLSWPVTISQSVNGGRPERVQATQVTVVVEPPAGGGTDPHIQTAFGRT